ncbi:MAG: UDP-3-O-(3-hydroxymyristoyl)glucosamine N-acyltransferase [Candidatus Binatia bacterium]
MIRKTLSELASLVGGRVIGDERVEICRVASIEEAAPGDITFLTHPRYRAYLEGCEGSAIIIGSNVPIPLSLEKNLLQVDQPYLAFAKILQLFTPPPQYDGQISPRATVDPTAVLGEQVTVFPHVYVSRGVRVSRGTVLFPGVFLGEGVEVGENCTFYPQVTIREGCRVGNGVVLHAGVVIGSDGFGYAGEGRERLKIPQAGIVEIGDDVEIGANTTVDRATLGRTVIGRGVKIDNLVQVAHNVVVGEYSVIVAQAGIAGSTRIGKEVILAGQVGVLNHLKIGDGARIGPQSGVPHSVPPGASLSGGIAAAPHKEWLKVLTVLPRLPRLWSAVRYLERKVAALNRGEERGKES